MDLLDFLYLDLQRLTSFASQLFEGLPASKTAETGREAEFGGDVEGSIPFLLKGGANTRALFSAASTITSTVHHELVDRVIDRLRAEGLLSTWDPDGPFQDGEFVIATGRLQIVDTAGMTTLMRQIVPIQKAIASLSAAEAEVVPVAQRKKAEATQQRSFEADKRKFENIAHLTETIGRDNVRIRILKGGASLATAIVERDKFVESLDRLVLRHGYLTGGDWTCLAQVNVGGGSDFYQTEGQGMLDYFEQGGVEALQTVATLGATAGSSVSLTPLAVYRTISRK